MGGRLIHEVDLYMSKYGMSRLKTMIQMTKHEVKIMHQPILTVLYPPPLVSPGGGALANLAEPGGWALA